MSDIPKVIECADHSYAPWVITCIHIMDGAPASDWRAVDVNDGREVENDWVCAVCYDKHMAGNDPVDDLHLICIHCLRHLMKLAGVKT